MSFKQLRLACALAVASVAWYSTISSAAIVEGTVTGGNSGGVFQLLTSPPAVAGPDAFQSPNLIAFDERQDWTLPSSMEIDSNLTLPPGVVISSYYIAFDPDELSTLQGIIEFDEPIIAWIGSPEVLYRTAPLLGAPSTSYSMSPATVPELGGNDIVMIDPANPCQLEVRFGACSPGDQLRVLTGVIPIPEPSTLLLGSLALGSIALIRFRNSKL